MADEKQKYVRTTTPKGKANYPWLNTPDTKFDADGVFKCNLIVPAKEAKALIKQIDDEVKKAVADAKAKAKPADAKKIKEGEKPYAEEVDDEGEPTGNIVFKTKQRAKIKTKKGDIIDKVIPIFDAKGTRIQANVGGGSTLKLNVELAYYYVAAQKTAGVSLRLQAVQVYDLVEFGSGASAGSYGFSDDEDGYEGEAYVAPSKSNNNKNKKKKSSDDSDDSEESDEEDVY